MHFYDGLKAEISVTQLAKLISSGEGIVCILDTGLGEASRKAIESNMPKSKR